MASDANKMNDATSIQPTEPAPCANGCGFFGTAATNGYCSKCFRDIRTQLEQAASAKAAVDKLVNNNIFSSSGSEQSEQTLFGSGHESGPSQDTLLYPAADQVKEKGKENASNRCLSCNKKVGVMGFKCKCGDTFCGSHRYPEKHDCEFDFKKSGRDAIAKANPVVKADKVDRI